MRSVAKWFVLVVISGLLQGAAPASSSAQCITTSFVTDGSGPLTAKLVNPAAKVTGTVNASPCNVGVYFDTGQGQAGTANVTTNTLIGPKKPLPPPPRPRPRPH